MLNVASSSLGCEIGGGDCGNLRSEERRVGKECHYLQLKFHLKEKKKNP